VSASEARSEPKASEVEQWQPLSPSPLRLGLSLGTPSRSEGWQRALALAARADALGLHSLWVPEHHFDPGATPAPLATLAAFAVGTRRVRLATTSLLLPLHHPLRLAAEISSLDALSHGRTLIGLGRGFRARVFDAFGVDTSAKRDRFDESLDAMIAAWSGEPVELAGPHFAAKPGESLRLALAPVQRPHPPLVVAAFGKKGLSQAARRALPYLASPLESLPALAENYALWEAERTGEPPPDTPRVPVMRIAYAAASDGEARRVREALENDALAAARRAPAALARAASEPISARAVVGVASFVRDEIARYRERIGMDLLVARTELPGTTEPERDAALERLAELAAHFA
jgi:alkanesulfonate monooxygenase SsuD/methylene tetrahydromethanopterin reductase-like flavin-dependent oxidoreductase (luciferase family)